jgi:hypothetical protein
VTYADDFVILCRKGKAEEALRRLREIMGNLKLTVSEEKTRICKVPQFDFLGYSVTGAPTYLRKSDCATRPARGNGEKWLN